MENLFLLNKNWDLNLVILEFVMVFIPLNSVLAAVILSIYSIWFQDLFVLVLHLFGPDSDVICL